MYSTGTDRSDKGWIIRLVPDFRGQFFSFLDKQKKSFLLWQLENCSTKRVRISSTYFHVLKYSTSCFVCCLNSYQSIYWLTPLKIIHSKHWRVCVRNCQWWPFKQSNCQWRPLKQSTFKYTTVVLLWNYCEYKKILWLKWFPHKVLYIY